MMKKRLFSLMLVLIFAFCFALGACNSGEQGDIGGNGEPIDQEIPDGETNNNPDSDDKEGESNPDSDDAEGDPNPDFDDEEGDPNPDSDDKEGEVDPVPTMEGFTLQEAYEAGLITVEDLETLSHFPKDTLGAATENAIKASYAAEHNEQWNTTYTANNIRLLGYFGEYHGLYAVRLLPDDVDVAAVEIESTIGGVHFIYGQAPEITVWRTKNPGHVPEFPYYDFEEDNLIVVLDSEISAVNKIHDPSFFKGIDVDYIVDLTHRDYNFNVGPDFRQILQIFLKDGTKQKVLEAIEILNALDGVYFAEPNYLIPIDD